MKRAVCILLIAVILIVCAPLAQAAGAERNQYDMDFTIDMDEKLISGRFGVTAFNGSQDAWSGLCLRDYATTLLEMAGDAPAEFIGIKDASGAELKYYRDDSDPSIVYVELNEPIPPGGSGKITIEYSAGIPKLGNGARYGWQPIPTDEGQLIFELANFYPVLAIYEDGGWVTEPYFNEGECFYSSCADYGIKLTLPDSYTVVSTGGEVMGESKEGMTTWTISAKNVRDVAFTTCPNMGWFSGTTKGGAKLKSYYYEGDNRHATEAQASISFDTVLGAMNYYEEIIGPYPYGSIDVVMSALEGFGGMEYPMYVRCSDYSVNIANREDTIMRVSAHEAAHQWFYAVVGNNQYTEAWLDEGFATLLEILYFYHIERYDIADEIVDGGRARVAGNKALASEYVNLPYDELGENYGGAVYSKAGLFLFDLLQAMGEDDFFKMIKDYYEEYSFKEAKTDDFISKVFEYSDSGEVRALVEENIKL